MLQRVNPGGYDSKFSSWTIHPVFCNNVTIADVSVHNPSTSDNTDGLDPDSVNGMKVINDTFLDEMPIPGLVFNNVSITNATQGISASNTSNVQMNNVSIGVNNNGNWFYPKQIKNDLGNLVYSQFTNSEFGGFLNGAQTFDGTTSQALPAALLNSQQGSVTAYVRTKNNFTTQAGAIVSGASATTPTNGFNLQLNTKNQFEFTMDVDGKSVDLASKLKYNDGMWHRVTATWDQNGNDYLFVDGRLVAKSNHIVDNVDLSDTSYIGQSVTGDSYYDGSLTNVNLYNYAISPSKA